MQTRLEIDQPLYGAPRAVQASAREVQVAPVVARDELMSNRRRIVSLVEQLADGDEVAERLGHLPPLDLQMLHVQPAADERLAGRCLRLRDLVLVMGEDQILAAE